MRDNYSWYSAAKNHPLWPNEKEPGKFKTFNLHVAQIPDGSTDCFVPPLIVFWPCIVPDTMFRMDQWSVKMIGLYFAGKENCFPMTLFFFIETDSSVEMVLTFVHFSYMQQTFIETLICSRHCIRCWQCKKKTPKNGHSFWF